MQASKFELVINAETARMRRCRERGRGDRMSYAPAFAVDCLAVRRIACSNRFDHGKLGLGRAADRSGAARSLAPSLPLTLTEAVTMRDEARTHCA
jgi:hypothetical protein